MRKNYLEFNETMWEILSHEVESTFDQFRRFRVVENIVAGRKLVDDLLSQAEANLADKAATLAEAPVAAVIDLESRRRRESEVVPEVTQPEAVVPVIDLESRRQAATAAPTTEGTVDGVTI